MNAQEIAQLSPNAHDRVRDHTADSVNQRIDADALERVTQYAFSSPEEIAARIDRLRREWDTERALEATSAAVALTGLALSLAHDRRWLFLVATTASFLGLHAIQGWCPPMEVYRRLGYRTRNEIDREAVSLKALRGDFDGVRRQPASEHAGQRARAAWEAARV